MSTYQRGPRPPGAPIPNGPHPNIAFAGGGSSPFVSRQEAADAIGNADLMALVFLFLIMIGGYHVHAMLTCGDWDFWVDWKDRRMWPTNILPTNHHTKYTMIDTNPAKNAATPTTSLPKVRIVPRSMIRTYSGMEVRTYSIAGSHWALMTCNGFCTGLAARTRPQAP
jgi:hypothetical protein